MSELQPNNTTGEMTFSSSLHGARWHRQPEPKAFERWYFDALSDDGREALVITFHDNYALSPRYFSQQENSNGKVPASPKKFPAVTLTYSIDGKIILRTINEFHSDEFAAGNDGTCSIGRSSFRIDNASYGSGYMIQIDVLTARKRRIKAELEWLSIESDLSESGAEDDIRQSACWNMAVPRSDVSGRITLVGRRGKVRRLIHFRGTGYHDHFRSVHSLTESVGSGYWGRAHFIDSTAVFRHQEREADPRCYSKLFLIRDGAIHERDIEGLEQAFVRNRHGLRLPERLSLLSSDNIRLRVKPIRVIQSGFFEAQVLSEMTLVLRDGKPRKTVGITELINPARMRSRFFRWMADMRVGKHGKGPFF